MRLSPAESRRRATSSSPRVARGGPPDGRPRPTRPSEPDERAIEWAERETARDGGAFHRRIDVTRIAVGGHSCGGLQALSVSHDQRIDTTLVLNSGIYNVPGSGRSRIQVEKAQLARLHGPTLYLTGGPSDIAHPNATDDVARIDRVPVFFGSLPVGHGAPSPRAMAVSGRGSCARWLDWHSRRTRTSEPDFAAKGLSPLHDSRWTIVQKQLPVAGRNPVADTSASRSHSRAHGVPRRDGATSQHAQGEPHAERVIHRRHHTGIAAQRSHLDRAANAKSSTACELLSGGPFPRERFGE